MNSLQTLLKHNLQQGFRLAFFMPVKRQSFVVNYRQIILLISLFTALWVIGDFIYIGKGASFNKYGISYLVFSISYHLLAFFLIGLFFNRQRICIFILVMFSALCFHEYIFILYSLLDGLNEDHYDEGMFYLLWAFWGLLYIWLFIIIFRAIAIVFSAAFLPNIITSILTTLVFYGILHYLPIDYLFYTDNEDEVTEDYEPLDIEAIYYQQAALVKQHTQALKAHQKNQHDVFLITFAPYASQDVFKREVSFVAEAVEQRFKNKAHSIMLLNHRDSVNELPLANQPNLDAVIAAIKQRMDVEEDAMMLYLTSHGSKDARLSAVLETLQPKAIDATALKSMLDEHGIKWRIIIVSACYSGSFIESLQDDYTLIMTAAAADKTSFGCHNDRELTYFGEALFKYAWPQQQGLLETFALAKTWVTEKELAEDKINSEPQIYVGSEMNHYLEKLEATLFSTK